MYRWAKCPASPYHLVDFPVPPKSYTQEGTKAHDLGEAMLLGNSYDESQYDEATISNVKMYAQYVKSLQAKLKGELHVELKVEVSSVSPLLYGRADAIIVSDKRLDVIDYKNGKSTVYAKENKQFSYYALGAIDTLELRGLDKIVLHCVQPNIKRKNKFDVWDTDSEYINSFRQELSEALSYAKANRKEYNIGQWCFFCNTAECPAHVEKLTEDMTDIQQLSF